MHANRGMGLESIIDYTNKQLEVKEIGNVQKLEVPIKITKKRGNNIVGKLMGKSTLDYRGNVLISGMLVPVSFDSKETKLNYFPLGNLKDNQVGYMKLAHKLGEVSFLIVRFTNVQKIMFCSSDVVIPAYDEWIKQKKSGKVKRGVANISIDLMSEIKSSDGLVVNYPLAVKEYIGGKYER